MNRMYAVIGKERTIVVLFYCPTKTTNRLIRFVVFVIAVIFSLIFSRASFFHQQQNFKTNAFFTKTNILNAPLSKACRDFLKKKSAWLRRRGWG
jgi:hypothetical protein